MFSGDIEVGHWQVNESSSTKECSLKVGNKYDHSRLPTTNDPDITKTSHQIAASTPSR